MRSALGGLQRNVATEPLGDDHVRHALADVGAFDEAMILKRQVGLAQKAPGLADGFNTLHFFDADVEQANAWLADAEQAARHRRAHDRIGDELISVSADGGAHVEHDGTALQRGPDGRNCRARHTLDGGEHQLGHGHQRAGIASRNGGVGIALLHRVNGQPHAGGLAAAADGLRRLVVHGDGNIGMVDAGAALEGRQPVKLGIYARRIPEQHEAQLRPFGQRERGARQHHSRAVVSTHGVKRNHYVAGVGSQQAGPSVSRTFENRCLPRLLNRHVRLLSRESHKLNHHP